MQSDELRAKGKILRCDYISRPALLAVLRNSGTRNNSETIFVNVNMNQQKSNVPNMPSQFLANHAIFIHIIIAVSANLVPVCLMFQERMQELERKEIEMELEDKRRMEIKKNLINDAAKKQDEPVDDSKLVEAMFDFLPDSSSEAPTPARETSVFNVSCNELWSSVRRKLVGNDIGYINDPANDIGKNRYRKPIGVIQSKLCVILQFV